MKAYFTQPNFLLTVLGLSLATFMQVLDTTIANVSLPTIAGNLGVSADKSSWVITSFAVSQAIGLPLTGFLSRRFGEVKVFVWCTFLFVVASFACGIAQSMTELILFRVLQGAVCGPMYPVAQSLMIGIYPPHKRGMAIAIIAMVTVVAPIAGPVLGGWITENISWRWIFLINVPVGLYCSFMIRAQMKAKVEETVRPRMDYVGLFTLILGVGLLQIVLDKGNELDWFQSDFIVTASIISAITLTVFIVWELTDKDPIVDLKLFRHHNFRYGTLALVLAYSAFFATGLLLPLWLQRILGFTASWSGLTTAPIGIIPLLLSFFIGKYAARIDMRMLASVAFVAMSGVSFLYSTYNLEVSYWNVAFAQLLMGIGVTFFFMPVLTILISDLAPNEIASGSGVASFLRVLGGSFAASIITSAWDHRASFHHARLAEHITAYDAASQHAMATISPDSQAQALGLLNQIITQQSFQMSFNEIYYVLGWVFISLIAVTWLAKPPFIAGGGKAPAAEH